MTYVWIFGTSYLAALALVLTLYKNKTDKDLSRRTALLLARDVLMHGTITGLIVSAYKVAV